MGTYRIGRSTALPRASIISLTVRVSVSRPYAPCEGAPGFASRVAATRATSSAPTSGMTVLSCPHGRKAVLCSEWLLKGCILGLSGASYTAVMRYRPEHKLEIHQKIVKDASERIRAEGLNGAAVSTVMRDAGLTHGGFYKHFASKEELLIESLKEGFREIIDTLIRAAEQSPPGEAWKAIVKTYLRPEMCEHPEHGCPLATLAPELARVDRRMKPQIVAELVNYKSRMVPFMPGRRPM